jgi:hypothetical protein
MRVSFKPYDEDNLVMVLVIPKHMIEKMGADDNTPMNAVFFEDEIRIYKTRNVMEIGREIE